MRMLPGNIINDVLVGREGYLFLHQGAQRQFDYLLGVKSPSVGSINNFIRNIESRDNYCRKNNILYQHIVFPSKPVIKQNFLPDGYRDVRSVYASFYESDKLQDIILYPRSLLNGLEVQGVSTFKKGDTHNTDKAKYSLTKKILNRVAVPFDSLEISYVNKIIKGDLSNMSGCPCLTDESEALFPVSGGRIFGNRQNLPSNTNEVLISQLPDSPGSQRLLIFGDSFFKDLIPFLEGVFSSIIYIRSPFFHRDIVKMFQPDIVLTGNAERYLSNVTSDDGAENFLFSLYGCPDYRPNIDYLNALKAELSFYYYPNFYKNYKSRLFSSLPIQTGRVERTNGGVISGWCIDEKSAVPRIDVMVNGIFKGSVICNSERKDVQNKHPNKNKLNGFAFSCFLDDNATVECFIAGTKVSLKRI